ncbi:PAS domain-containing sensor histidine kinase [Pseudomonas sp. SWI6]|uniref:two-component system sensor histidine kinase NtrB n=1 Tax=unclassified Pseudomonas TaxID=196821 RepID=UPI000CE5D6A9|nr:MULTISPECIES: PAS domain-containing sensor histidine kinase [unclassified Pseudomonas]AVD82523.1 PAS domain-containing sensor histidine kinase [Pseudomonas sp. SWI6]AVD89478.1 PAS domain-containing sensor histidine kinase [Pseudomonas sp. SWI44]MPT01139.1 PAS domain-containing sensor histidine kinase [Pseudomonas sp.]WEZ87047.1 PAS domain S-box protein [Pseudomonas sp. NyZ480]
MVSAAPFNHPVMPANRYEQLVQSVVDYAIYMLDPTGHVVSWNAGAERIKGYRAEEVIGQHFSLFFTEQDCAQGRPDVLLRQALEQGVAQDEGWRVRKDGTQFWALAALDVIRDSQGQVVGLAKVTRDITDRRDSALQLDAMRAQLFQAQKLEALGQLTGGLAHDFNNLLTIILNSARMALVSQDPKRVQRMLEHILDAGKRGTELTQQLLSFARHRQLDVTRIAPAELIASTRGLLEHALPSDIELNERLQPDLPLIEVDAGQLQMVLLNLLFNARDAIEGPGQISIEVDAVELAGEVEGLRGRYVRFEVRDTGAGIDPQTLPRIFEPFFTTKAFGKGTGLGLSQVYGFAKQSNGAICVESATGQGTCMSLYLPVYQHEAEPTTDR